MSSSEGIFDDASDKDLNSKEDSLHLMESRKGQFTFSSRGGISVNMDNSDAVKGLWSELKKYRGFTVT